MFFNKSLYCGDISIYFINSVINLCGWIYKIRNYGKLIFIDLKDKTGIIQLVLEKKNKYNKYFLKLNYCIFIKGILIFRNKNSLNFFLKTGYFEVIVLKLYLFSFSLKDELYIELKSKKKLKDRFLFLRSNFMQNNLFIKYNIYKYIRYFFNYENFIDVETPTLINLSKEGARSFLIPDINFIGNFFSLPQSPQIFKQVLMISWFDKYYQIVKCYRNENFRSDRQSEFTQLDFEISFCKEIDIMLIFENLLKLIFKKILNINLKKFSKINYNESVFLFFSDKPDLRFKLKYYNLIKLKIFLRNYIRKKVFFIKIPSGIKLFGNGFKNYKFILRFFFINKFIFFITNKNNYNFFYFNIKKKIIFEFLNILNFNSLDLIFFFINRNKNYFFKYYFILLVSSFSKKNNLINFSINLTWIKKFFLYIYNYKTTKYKFSHNPFSSPLEEDVLYLDFKPNIVISISYDITYNNLEIGGGSIRNYKIFIQKKSFKIVKKISTFNLSFFIKTLKFSPPPHGGIAIGLDRLISSLIGIKYIKDIIAFPKNNNNRCEFTKSPKNL